MSNNKDTISAYSNYTIIPPAELSSIAFKLTHDIGALQEHLRDKPGFLFIKNLYIPANIKASPFIQFGIFNHQVDYSFALESKPDSQTLYYIFPFGSIRIAKLTDLDANISESILNSTNFNFSMNGTYFLPFSDFSGNNFQTQVTLDRIKLSDNLNAQRAEGLKIIATAALHNSADVIPAKGLRLPIGAEEARSIHTKIVEANNTEATNKTNSSYIPPIIAGATLAGAVYTFWPDGGDDNGGRGRRNPHRNDQPDQDGRPGGGPDFGGGPGGGHGGGGGDGPNAPGGGLGGHGNHQPLEQPQPGLGSQVGANGRRFSSRIRNRENNDEAEQAEAPTKETHERTWNEFFAENIIPFFISIGITGLIGGILYKTSSSKINKSAPTPIDPKSPEGVADISSVWRYQDTPGIDYQLNPNRQINFPKEALVTPRLIETNQAFRGSFQQSSPLSIRNIAVPHASTIVFDQRPAQKIPLSINTMESMAGVTQGLTQSDTQSQETNTKNIERVNKKRAREISDQDLEEEILSRGLDGDTISTDSTTHSRDLEEEILSRDLDGYIISTDSTTHSRGLKRAAEGPNLSSITSKQRLTNQGITIKTGALLPSLFQSPELKKSLATLTPHKTLIKTSKKQNAKLVQSAKKAKKTPEKSFENIEAALRILVESKFQEYDHRLMETSFIEPLMQELKIALPNGVASTNDFLNHLDNVRRSKEILSDGFTEPDEVGTYYLQYRAARSESQKSLNIREFAKKSKLTYEQVAEIFESYTELPAKKQAKKIKTDQPSQLLKAESSYVYIKYFTFAFLSILTQTLAEAKEINEAEASTMLSPEIYEIESFEDLISSNDETCSIEEDDAQDIQDKPLLILTKEQTPSLLELMEANKGLYIETAVSGITSIAITLSTPQFAAKPAIYAYSKLASEVRLDNALNSEGRSWGEWIKNIPSNVYNAASELSLAEFSKYSFDSSISYGAAVQFSEIACYGLISSTALISSFVFSHTTSKMGSDSLVPYSPEHAKMAGFAGMFFAQQTCASMQYFKFAIASAIGNLLYPITAKGSQNWIDFINNGPHLRGSLNNYYPTEIQEENIETSQEVDMETSYLSFHNVTPTNVNSSAEENGFALPLGKIFVINELSH